MALAQKPSSSLVASLIALVMLLLGASGAFAQLQDAGNTVWAVEPKTGRGIWGTIKGWFFSLVAVPRTELLRLVSLVLSARTGYDPQDVRRLAPPTRSGSPCGGPGPFVRRHYVAARDHF